MPRKKPVVKKTRKRKVVKREMPRSGESQDSYYKRMIKK